MVIVLQGSLSVWFFFLLEFLLLPANCMSHKNFRNSGSYAISCLEHKLSYSSLRAM